MLKLHLDIIIGAWSTRSPSSMPSLGKALAPIRQRTRLLTTIPGG